MCVCVCVCACACVRACVGTCIVNIIVLKEMTVLLEICYVRSSSYKMQATSIMHIH